MSALQDQRPQAIDARDTFDEISSKQPSDFLEVLRKIKQLVARKSIDEAINVCNINLEKAVGSAAFILLSKKGKLLVQKKEFQGALYCIQKALQTGQIFSGQNNKNILQLKNMRGDLYDRLGNTKQAIVAYKEANSCIPNDYSYYSIARIQEREGDYSDANYYYEKGLKIFLRDSQKLNPETYENILKRFLMRMCFSYQLNKETQKFLDLLADKKQNCMKLTQKDFIPRLQGICYIKLGKEDKAIKCFERCQQYEKQSNKLVNPRTNFNMALAFRNQLKWIQVKKELKFALDNFVLNTVNRKQYLKNPKEKINLQQILKFHSEMMRKIQFVEAFGEETQIQQAKALLKQLLIYTCQAYESSYDLMVFFKQNSPSTRQTKKIMQFNKIQKLVCQIALTDCLKKLNPKLVCDVPSSLMIDVKIKEHQIALASSKNILGQSCRIAEGFQDSITKISRASYYWIEDEFEMQASKFLKKWKDKSKIPSKELLLLFMAAKIVKVEASTQLCPYEFKDALQTTIHILKKISDASFKQIAENFVLIFNSFANYLSKDCENGSDKILKSFIFKIAKLPRSSPALFFQQLNSVLIFLGQPLSYNIPEFEMMKKQIGLSQSAVKKESFSSVQELIFFIFFWQEAYFPLQKKVENKLRDKFMEMKTEAQSKILQRSVKDKNCETFCDGCRLM